MPKSVLLTGSQGFIGSYIAKELLEHDYTVVGVDNFSKYGKVIRSHDKHKNFIFVESDCAKSSFLEDMAKFDFDYIIAGAAMIGGISYFHKFAYDLLSTNEKIISNTFDLALERYKKNQLQKILVLSSSMVYENVSDRKSVV